MSKRFVLVLVALLVAAFCSTAFAGPQSTASTGRNLPVKTGKQSIPEIVVPKAPVVKDNGTKAWYFQEDFEGTWLPAGWDTARVAGTYATFLQHVSSGINPTCSPYSGLYMVCFYSYLAPNGDRMRLITPPVNISSVNDTLSFWMVHDPGYDATYTERIVIEVMAKPSGGSWGAWAGVDSFYRYQTDPTAWLNHTIPLGAYYGDSVRISFTGHSTYGNAMYFDDVAIGCTYIPTAHDMCLQSINNPATTVVPSVPFLPAATIWNRGMSGKESDFYTYYQIADSTGAVVYNDSVAITTPDSIGIDSTRVLNFASFSPADSMRYTATACAVLAGDGHPENDTLVFHFRDYDLDVGTAAIVAPGTSFIPTATVTPQVTFHNYATQAATFTAYFQISYNGSPIYLQNMTITLLAGGADTTVNFPDWTGPHANGAYQVQAYTTMPYDLNPANDAIIQNTMGSWMTWTPIALSGSYHEAQWPGSCTAGGKLYIVGGINSSQTTSSYVQVYDTATGAWTQLAAMPNPAFGASCAVINGKMYVIGGFTTASGWPVQAYTRIYDISSDIWSTGTPPSDARGFAGGGVVNGKMYMVGGTFSSSWPTDCPTYMYDPAADTTSGTPWATCSPCPRGATGMTVGAAFYGSDPAVSLTKIYVGSDYRGSAATYGYYVYDPAFDTWTTIAQPPADVGGMATGLVWTNNHAWVFGGCPPGWWTSYSDKTYEYNPITDTWCDCGVLMNNQYEGAGSAIMGEKIYTFGGTTGSGGSTPPYFEWTVTSEYNPTGVAGKPSSAAPGTFALYNNYPNPFHGQTKINFQTAKAGYVNLAVYSITGQLVKTLVSESRPAGFHSINWNGQDNNGHAVSSGIYFYRLIANSISSTHKLVVIK